MPRSRFIPLALVAAGVLAGGCVPRFGAEPALAFRDIPYSGPDGHAWPVTMHELPATANAYGMARPPRVAVVDLNPTGQRGTLVFIHGLGSYLKFWWFQLDAFAADGWRVVAVDLPGYGKSEKPASFPYTMEAMADAVREVVQSLGIEHPVLIGHSMGGQTALSYAIRYPQEPRALVLTSPAGFETFSPREQDWFARVYTVSLVKSVPEYGIWGTVAQANFARFRPELEWLVEERVRLAKTPDFDSYAYAQVRSVQGLAHDDFVRESLGQITVPTIILFGEDDRLIPNPFMHGGRVRSVMESGARGIHGAQLVGLEGCGHCVQLDCPAEYNTAVRDFLDALSVESGPASVAPAPASETAAPASPKS